MGNAICTAAQLRFDRGDALPGFDGRGTGDGAGDDVATWKLAEPRLGGHAAILADVLVSRSRSSEVRHGG